MTRKIPVIKLAVIYVFLTANDNLVNVKTLQICFNEGISRERGENVDTVEDRIQNAFLTANDGNFTHKIELEIKSINASSRRYVTSGLVNSEHDEHERVTALFQDVNESITTLYVFSSHDETPNNTFDKVGELLVPGTRFDRQPHSPHTVKR